MNKKLLFIALAILSQQPAVRGDSSCPATSASCHDCGCKASSHTFFSIRPVFTINSPEYLSHNRDFYKQSLQGYGGTVQATVLGGKSTHNDGLTRFFTPFCKTTLAVNEAPLPGTDILANQLNIYTVDGTYQSTVAFEAQHSYVGVGLNYQQKFYERCNGHGLWFSISGPILRVHNTVQIVETVINNGGGPRTVAAATPTTAGCPANCPNSCNTDCLLDPAVALAPVGSVVAAFSQPGWCFGRIDNSATGPNHTKTRIGDITLRIGYETVKREDCHLDSFFGFLVPTGNTPNAVNVFEPIVGHNHHWGFIMGSTFGLEIWHSEAYNATFSSEFDFNITTLFERSERRSFDLKYKPWSRYMQFYKNIAQAELANASVDPVYSFTLHTPGIDILTQSVKVKPGYYRAFNGAFYINRCGFELELGYNFYARQAECLRLDCDFPTGAALKAINVGGGETGLYQNISNSFTSNCLGTGVTAYANNVITVDDIDLESAAHPATLTHTAYGSLAYYFDWCDNYPMYIAAGGSYEFPPDNVGLNRWMAWGKFGIAF